MKCVLFILLSTASLFNKQHVYLEPSLKDSIKILLFAECFYSYPPEDNKHIIHSIDADSICFLSNRTRVSYPCHSITCPYYKYLWLKYGSILLDMVRISAETYQYNKQRINCVESLVLIPDTTFVKEKKQALSISKRLSSRKWHKRWKLAFRSPKRLDNNRNTAIGYVNSCIFKADSLFLIELFNNKTIDESIFLYDHSNQIAEGFYFPHRRKGAIPELKDVDEATLAQLQKLIDLDTIISKKQVEGRSRVFWGMNVDQLFSVLLLCRRNNEFFPCSYSINIMPVDNNEFWLLSE